MRTTPATLATRLTLLAGAVGGAVVAVEGVRPDRVARITADACIAHLPGSAARCDTDRAADHVGPYLLPGAIGFVVGLAVAVAVIVVARLVLQATRAQPVVATTAPIVGGTTRIRCARCGANVTPGVSGTRSASGRVLCHRCGAGG